MSKPKDMSIETSIIIKLKQSRTQSKAFCVI